MTALLYACEKGAENCVTVLLRSGADATAQNSKEETPLMIAKRHGDVRAIDELEEYMSDMRHSMRRIASKKQIHDSEDTARGVERLRDAKQPTSE